MKKINIKNKDVKNYIIVCFDMFYIEINKYMVVCMCIKNLYYIFFI